MSVPSSTIWHVSAAQHGQRLDKALEALFPHWGLRARRRLCDAGGLGVVLVNGKARLAAYKLTAGDVIHFVAHGTCTEKNTQIAESADCVENGQSAQKYDAIYCVQTYAQWAFFYKPAGMHSVSLHETYTGAKSFEALYTSDIQGRMPVLLCNRLDQQTSGLMVVAQDLADVQTWKNLEDAGLCEKRYVALVCGRLTQKLRVTNMLQVHKRKISRVLAKADDALRHTHFIPLGTLCAEDIQALAAFFPALQQHNTAEVLSFVGCVIHKGARHQIRAHAAYSGLPLWHDTRYTQRYVPQEECFVLHHGGVRIASEHKQYFVQVPQNLDDKASAGDGTSVCCLPPWQSTLSSELRQRMSAFFENTLV